MYRHYSEGNGQTWMSCTDKGMSGPNFNFQVESFVRNEGCKRESGCTEIKQEAGAQAQVRKDWW